MIRVPSQPRTTSPPVRDYISYSAIGTYMACPLRYYFRYCVGLPEQTVSASLVFGSAIHRGVEHHFNELLAGNEPPTLEALLAEYDRHWQETDREQVKFGKDDNLESLNSLAMRMFTAFQASRLAQPAGHIIGVEEQLRGSVIKGAPELLGRLDLLVETDEALQIVDFKTSRSRWSADQVDDAAGQLLLYSELVRPFAPHKKLRLQFAVLTKTKDPQLDMHEVAYDRHRVDRIKRIVERVWQAIDAKLFYPAPSLMQCPSCPFREPCRAWCG